VNDRRSTERAGLAVLYLYQRMEEDLRQKYKELFKSPPGCGEYHWPRGWTDLVHQLLRDFARINETTGEEIKISFIKEKYGHLRVGLANYPCSDEVEELREKANADSRYICQVCGCGEGKLHSDASNYEHILCKTCAASWNQTWTYVEESSVESESEEESEQEEE